MCCLSSTQVSSSGCFKNAFADQGNVTSIPDHSCQGYVEKVQHSPFRQRTTLTLLPISKHHLLLPGHLQQHPHPTPPHPTIHYPSYNQDSFLKTEVSTIFSIKGQIVNISGFAGLETKSRILCRHFYNKRDEKISQNFY